jgi:hypothetical protein
MLLFVRLIRDADKLDIWRVFIEYYEAPIEERASAVTLGLLDLPKYSESVLSCINEKRVASLSTLKTLNDFKLMQLSWIYDLNFAPTFALLEERNYIQRIASTLPLTDEIRSAAERLTDYVRLRQSNA